MKDKCIFPGCANKVAMDITLPEKCKYTKKWVDRSFWVCVEHCTDPNLTKYSDREIKRQRNM